MLKKQQKTPLMMVRAIPFGILRGSGEWKTLRTPRHISIIFCGTSPHIFLFLCSGVKATIYVKDYADAKFGCVSVAKPKTCHYRPRELPGRDTKGPGTPRVVASYGLRKRDTQDFLACVMSDADEGHSNSVFFLSMIE